MNLQSIKEKCHMTDEQRQFYKMTASLTLPIALQNLMDTAVSGADVLMLNFVSEAAISAASLAGQVQFVLNMIFYGLSSGTAVTDGPLRKSWDYRFGFPCVCRCCLP